MEWSKGVLVKLIDVYNRHQLASINEVNLRRARLVLRWATVSGFNSRCRTLISVCNQPATQGQLSLRPRRYMYGVHVHRACTTYIPCTSHMHDVHVPQCKHYSEHVRHTVRHTCTPYMYSVNTVYRCTLFAFIGHDRYIIMSGCDCGNKCVLLCVDT